MILLKSKFIKDMKKNYNVDIIVDRNYTDVYNIFYPTFKGSTEFGQKRVEGFLAVEEFCKKLKQVYD